jgi:hypothetical protein
VRDRRLFAIAWLATGLVGAALGLVGLGAGEPLLWVPAFVALAASVVVLVRS